MKITAIKIEPPPERPSILLREMKPGDIGQIAEWNNISNYVGEWVKMTTDRSLLSLTSNVFWNDTSLFGDSFRVELLKPGEILQLKVTEE